MGKKEKNLYNFLWLERADDRWIFQQGGQNSDQSSVHIVKQSLVAADYDRFE